MTEKLKRRWFLFLFVHCRWLFMRMSERLQDAVICTRCTKTWAEHVPHPYWDAKLKKFVIFTNHRYCSLPQLTEANSFLGPSLPMHPDIDQAMKQNAELARAHDLKNQPA